MIRTLTPDERLVQCGITAARTPDGNFMASVPIYMVVVKSAVNERHNLTANEERLQSDAAGVFANMLNKYGKAARTLSHTKTSVENPT